MKESSQRRDRLKQFELAMSAEDAVHALREAAYDGHSESMERYATMLASQVEAFNWWIEGLADDDPQLETIRKLARGFNDWPFSMRPRSKNLSFGELAEKIQLAEDPLHSQPSKPEALSHRWLSFAIGKFNLAREYREHAKNEDALVGSLRAISPDEATATILIKASKLAKLSSDSHAEWLRLLVELTRASNDRDAVALVKNAEGTKKAQKGNFDNSLSSSLGGPLRQWW